MELRHLRYFRAVAETLNISEASRRLHVAQPSVSRQIRDLEFEVGHPLFDRHKGRLSLTAAGRAFRSGTAGIIGQVDAALDNARKAGTTRTIKLRVGYYGMMWATVIASALRQFRKLQPKSVVAFAELSPAQILAELKKGDLHIAVLGHKWAMTGREIAMLGIAPVAALIAISTENPISKRRVLCLEDLWDETFLSYAPDYAPGRDTSLLRACRTAKFKPKVVGEARGLAALLLQVAENRGVAVVSPFALRAPHPGVVFARLKPPGVSFDLTVVYRRDLPPVGHSLAEIIAETSRRDLGQKPPKRARWDS